VSRVRSLGSVCRVKVRVSLMVTGVRDSAKVNDMRWTFRHTGDTPNVWPKMPTVAISGLTL